MFSDHRHRNACAAFLAAMVLGGCTGGRYMAATATDTNLALEKSTNEMLLLNIIRASRQRPMYFTGLSGVSMVSSVTAGGGFSLPFGGDATNLFGFTPTFTAKAQPTSTIQILDNKEFMKAIHTPVKLDMLKLFLSAGWPKEVLLFMLVNGMKIKDGTKEKMLFYKGGENDPFEANITTLAVNTKIIDGKAKISLVDAPIPFGSEQYKKLMSQILELKKENLHIENVCLLKKGADAKLDTELDSLFPGINCRGADRAKWYILVKRPAPSKLLSYGEVGETVGLSGDAPNSGKIKQVFLRSPQGMLYFLGRIARTFTQEGYGSIGALESPRVFKRKKEEGVPLFEVSKGAAAGDAAVSVTYQGETFSIPAGPKHLSMMALSLISQVIALQKDPKSIPKPNIINLFSN